MHKIIAIVSAAAVAASGSLAMAAPANAAMPWWWYHTHHQVFNPGIGLGIGLFGFAAGAALANSGRYYDSYYGDDYYADSYYGGYHVPNCRAAYRSYDIRSDTYLGYDGYRHQCLL